MLEMRMRAILAAIRKVSLVWLLLSLVSYEKDTAAKAFSLSPNKNSPAAAAAAAAARLFPSSSTRNPTTVPLDHAYQLESTTATTTTSAAVSSSSPQAQQQQQQQVARDDTIGIPNLFSTIPPNLWFLSVPTVVELPQPQTQQHEQQRKDQKDRDVMFARLLLMAAAALYGTNFSLVKMMDESELPVGLSTTLRFGLAALATSPWLLTPVSKQEQQDAQDAGKMNPALGATLGGLEVGLWNSVGYISQAVGLETTLASKSAFLCSLAVVVVPFLDWLTGRHLKGREWVGAAMALAGVAFLELGGTDSNLFATWTTGDTASMLQPIFFGLGFWRMEKAMHRYPTQGKRCTAGQLLATALAAAVYCAFTERGHTGEWEHWQTCLMDPHLLAFIAWTGIASTAVSIYMETVALKTLSAAETTLLLSTEPLWGAGFAALIIGEQFGMDAVVGGMLILGGCLYSNLGLEGMQNFFRRRDGSNKGKKQASSGSVDNMLSFSSWSDDKDKQHQQQQAATAGSLGLSAMMLAVSVGDAWNNLSVGARVAMLQIQDIMEELL